MKKDKIRLDLACGNNKQKGFIGVDITKENTKADIEHNLFIYPWPFEDASVDETFSSHFLEHIPHGDGYNDPFYDFFNELWRVMKPGGKCTFVTPYYTSMRAFQDPTHQRFIGEASYLYLDKEWRKTNGLQHYPIHADFKVIGVNHAINGAMKGKAQDALAYLGMHNWNVIDDIQVTVQKPKGKTSA